MGGGQPPPFLLPTLRHSGTHFVLALFALPWYRLHVWQGEPGIIQTHLDMPTWGLLEPLLAVYPVVIPLRRPEAIARSHMARYGHVDDLLAGLARIPEVERRCKPLWLPVDAPDRDDYLARLCEGLGVRIETDWPVVDSRSPAYDGPVPDIGHNDFFGRFYAS